jgi:hypothetical protein
MRTLQNAIFLPNEHRIISAKGYRYCRITPSSKLGKTFTYAAGAIEKFPVPSYPLFVTMKDARTQQTINVISVKDAGWFELEPNAGYIDIQPVGDDYQFLNLQHKLEYDVDLSNAPLDNIIGKCPIPVLASGAVGSNVSTVFPSRHLRHVIINMGSTGGVISGGLVVTPLNGMGNNMYGTLRDSALVAPIAGGGIIVAFAPTNNDSLVTIGNNNYYNRQITFGEYLLVNAVLAGATTVNLQIHAEYGHES